MVIRRPLAVAITSHVRRAANPENDTFIISSLFRA